jgi:hypothetical protein
MWKKGAVRDTASSCVHIPTVVLIHHWQIEDYNYGIQLFLALNVRNHAAH